MAFLSSSAPKCYFIWAMVEWHRSSRGKECARAAIVVSVDENLELKPVPTAGRHSFILPPQILHT